MLISAYKASEEGGGGARPHAETGLGHARMQDCPILVTYYNNFSCSVRY